jgi:hypothetical protein
MTIEQALDKSNVGKRIKLHWITGRIFEGVLTSVFPNLPIEQIPKPVQECFVKIDGTNVWWSIKDLSKIEICEV